MNWGIPTYLWGFGLALMAIATAAVVGAVAQERPRGPARALLRGEAVDSTRAVPLDGADIYLWGTTIRARTDAYGRFELPDVPAGDYSVVLYHPRLVELGVSTVSRPVTVPPQGELAVVLSIPSRITIARGRCAGEGVGARNGIALGSVKDAETGVPLVGARITFGWGDPLRLVETRANREGWFEVCSLPTDLPIGVRAEFLSLSGPRQEVHIPPAGIVELDLPLGETRSADIAGTLLDMESGRPVEDAQVELVGSPFRDVSDSDGEFRFDDVPVGDYTIQVQHLAYGTRQDTLRVRGGLDVRLDIPLGAQPIQLEPITVTVLTDRSLVRAAMGGRVISREEIDRVRVRSRDVGDLLRSQNVAGLVISRSPVGVCIGFAPGQVRMFRDGRCEPVTVFIDGVRMVNPRVAADLPATLVDEMVLFRPVESGNLFGLGGGNGVLMIYTKRGRR